MKNLVLNTAITLSVAELNQPVITSYQLGKIYFERCASGKYKTHKIKNISESKISFEHFSKQLEILIETGVLTPYKTYTNVFSIIGKNIYSESEIACSIDPFAYISHLSAMDYHGLTDRIPKIIFISSPSHKEWKQFALKRMEKDFKDTFCDYKNRKLPRLTRILMEKVGTKHVNQFSSIHLGAFKTVKNKILRVSTIGRTFLDMLRAPDLCGGIYHVVDVYKEFAGRYLNLIVDEIDRHGKPIDKVRAGYIIEDLCSLKDDVIDTWVKFAVRGGSRRLDPSEEYSPEHSKRWCLSINVEIN